MVFTLFGCTTEKGRRRKKKMMMGEGEEEVKKTGSESQVEIEIQERGEIYFFYTPKVDREEAHCPADVQRLYMVLRPLSSAQSSSNSHNIEEKQDPNSGSKQAAGSTTRGGSGSQEVDIKKEPLMRIIILGRKSLPDPKNRSRPYWGFVDLVTTKIDHVKDALRGEEYDTSTRGHRHQPPARALGEGVYRILKHHPSRGRIMHTHLVYKLELPAESKKNVPQETFNIERQGSYIIQIKNPDQHGSSSQFRGLQNKRKPVFPAHLHGQFGHKRYCPADPPDFLNYEGCELLVISASDDIEEELGLELKSECEAGDDSCSESDLLKTFGDAAVTRPLLEGTWA